MARKAGWPIGSGQRAAQARVNCPYCGLRPRPCNLARHISARHPEKVDA